MMPPRDRDIALIPSEPSVWDNWILQIVRWVIFVPVGLTLSSLLMAGAVIIFAIVATTELKFTILTVIIVLMAISIGLPLMFMYITLPGGVSLLCCGSICPKPKIGVPIYIVVYVGWMISATVRAPSSNPWWATAILWILSISAIWGAVIALNPNKR